MNLSKILVSSLVGVLIGSELSRGDDWPQWRGPNRDDVSAETGLLSEWPSGGPKQLWRNDKCGLGYSGFSVVGDHLYTMGQEDGKQFVVCLNATDGQEIWRTAFGGDYKNNWGGGPRSTPTVAGDDVFALSADGIVACFDAGMGQENWHAALTDFGGNVPGWGYCESVLVDGDRVVCTPGGNKGAILSLDRKTGKKVWQSVDFTDGAQYASIVPATINGQKQYVQLTMKAVVGIDPVNGGVIWKAPWPGEVAVIPTPIVHENSVYVTSGYSVGSQRFDVDGATVKSAWSNKVMKNHHGGVIRIGDHVYGYSDGVGWICQDWSTGEAVWADKQSLGKGAIANADGRLYCLSESKGEVVLIEPSAEGWKEHGRFKLTHQSTRRSSQGAIWTHPVIANGRLYLRDQEIVCCYDIKQN